MKQEDKKASRPGSKQEEGTGLSTRLEAGHSEEIEVLKKKMEEYLDGWKRAKADYLNLKKDTEKQLRETVMFANASLIFELLPVMDNFELAIRHIPAEQKDSDWTKGVIQIKKQLEDILKVEGIEKIKTVGEKFNPEWYEAIAHEEVKDKESGTIIEEIEAGYKLNDKVIRPAKVKVVK